jgi:cell division septation protein DedD
MKSTSHERVRRRPREPSRPRRRLLPVLLVLLLVSSAAAGWHYMTNIRPRRLPARPMVATPTNQAIQPRPVPRAIPPVPTGVALRYSVSMAIYGVLDQAQERVEQLRKDAPSMNFYVAPTVVQGSIFYRVMAGPLPDTMSAAAVRDTLMSRRIKTFSSGSDLLDTPYAFLIGTFARRGDADAKAAEATSKGIPTYVLPVGSSGAVLYKVYVGAYTGPGDAEFLREILERASLPDSLVERTGSISS